MAEFLVNRATPVFQFLRYGIVGLVSNGLGYVIFLGLTNIGIGPKLAMTLLYLTSTALSYWGNWRWTFASNGSFFKTSYRFLLVYLGGYLLNFAILYSFVDIYHYAFQWVQAISIFIVSLFLFTALRIFVFGATNPRDHG